MTPRCSCAFRSRSPPLFTRVDPSYRRCARGPLPSFCIKSSWAACVWPQPLLGREDHDPSNVFIFPVNAFLQHTKVAAHSSIDGKVITADLQSENQANTLLFSRRPLSTKSVNKDGTEEALYRSNTARSARQMLLSLIVTSVGRR